MAGEKTSNKSNPMDELRLRDEDRKRYENWDADRKSLRTYESFVRVRSTLSLGRKHRFYCEKQNRIVSLLSDGELRAYKYLCWLPNVISIEEQFALDPVLTFELAKRLKIPHPYCYKQNIHHVMSTDFIVSTVDSDGVVIKTAYSYKPHFNSKKPSRTGKKLQLEEQYWSCFDIPYRLVTNEHFSKEWFLTLRFCEMHYDCQADVNQLQSFSEQLFKVYEQDPWLPLRRILRHLARILELQYIEAETLFKNAVLRDCLPISKTAPLRLNEALILD